MCFPFSNFGNWITFGPLQVRCLFYIWTTLLITIHTFAVIISLHVRKYAICFIWPSLDCPYWNALFSFVLFLFLLCYSSGHLTRKPYGCFRCPGNTINAVLMWFVFCGDDLMFVYSSQINWYWSGWLNSKKLGFILFLFPRRLNSSSSLWLSLLSIRL